MAPGLGKRGIILVEELQAQRVRLPVLLADVLLNHLFGNAIRHNVDGGELLVRTGQGSLVIENTGAPLRQDPARMFERFRKESTSAESLGLGLAIVREICDKYGCRLDYSYGVGRHRMVVEFNKQPSHGEVTLASNKVDLMER